MTKTTTIDLQDRIDEIRDEEIPSLEESKRDLGREAKEEYGTADDAPREYHQAHDEFQSEIDALEGKAEIFEESIEENGGGVYKLRKLKGAKLMEIEDRVNDESFDVDVENETIDGVPKQGYEKALYTRLTIVDFPDGCQTNDRGYCDVGDLDGSVYEYLFEKVKNLNAAGRVDLGNSSLADTMQDI